MKKTRIVATLACASALVLGAACMVPAGAGIQHAEATVAATDYQEQAAGEKATAPDLSAPESKKTDTAADSEKKPTGKWKTSKGSVYYVYANKKKATGLKKIDGKTYYFGKKGAQRVGWQKVGSKYRFFKISSGAAASMVSSKVVNGIRLDEDGVALYGSTGKAELTTMVAAQKICQEKTKLTDSRSTKMRKLFSYLVRNVTEIVVRPMHNVSGWHRTFANDIVIRKAGDCISFGASYAYLCNAAGCTDCKITSSVGHGWAEVGGLVCDPEWSKHNSRWFYAVTMGESGHGGTPAYASSRSYVVTNAPRTKPWDAKIAKALKSGKDGLVKQKGAYYFYKAGKKLKSTWKKYKGKKYYFKSNGKAAVGSVKIKGTYYVFNKKGVLQKGDGIHFVKVNGVKYRVKASGKAASGWADGGTRCYLPDGVKACGLCLIDDKLCLFSEKGVYDAETSAGLQQAQEAKDAAAIIALLGDPDRVETTDSCADEGLDGFYYYGKLCIITFEPAGTTEKQLVRIK